MFEEKPECDWNLSKEMESKPHLCQNRKDICDQLRLHCYEKRNLQHSNSCIKNLQKNQELK